MSELDDAQIGALIRDCQARLALLAKIECERARSEADAVTVILHEAQRVARERLRR